MTAEAVRPLARGLDLERREDDGGGGVRSRPLLGAGVILDEGGEVYLEGGGGVAVNLEGGGGVGTLDCGGGEGGSEGEEGGEGVGCLSTTGGAGGGICSGPCFMAALVGTMGKGGSADGFFRTL